MSTDTTEKGLEKHITDYLVSANGYVLRTFKPVTIFFRYRLFMKEC